MTIRLMLRHLRRLMLSAVLSIAMTTLMWVAFCLVLLIGTTRRVSRPILA
jgi:hypothetical protein